MKKTTKKGVAAGILTGFFTTIIWSSLPELRAIVTERLISFALSIFAVFIVSIMTQNEN